MSNNKASREQYCLGQKECPLYTFQMLTPDLAFHQKLVLEKKNPFYPDSKHLHMLLFKLFKKKNILIKANYKTGLCVNLFYLTSLLPLIFFYKNFIFLKIYFFLLLVFYLILYFTMRYKCLKK